MTALSGVAIQRNIYESSASLVYRGARKEDGRVIVIKRLKQEYPLPQALTRYRQEYVIPQPERSRQGTQPLLIGGSHRMNQGAPSAMCEEAA